MSLFELDIVVLQSFNNFIRRFQYALLNSKIDHFPHRPEFLEVPFTYFAIPICALTLTRRACFIWQ